VIIYRHVLFTTILLQYRSNKIINYSTIYNKVFFTYSTDENHYKNARYCINRFVYALIIISIEVHMNMNIALPGVDEWPLKVPPGSIAGSIANLIAG